MRCPSCGESVNWTFDECPNCGVALRDARSAPPPDPNIRLTPVLAVANPALIALAKSLLDAEGIAYLVRGENVQDLFGWGQLGAGFNIVTGPAEFVVREDDAQRARELLRNLTDSSRIDEDEKPEDA
jgi:hypothetical protein